MIPAQAATQKIRLLAIVEVVERVRGTPLLPDEGHPGCQRDHGQTQDEGALARHGREVDREHQAGHQQDREDAAEVVDRLGGLVDVGGDEHPGHHERDDRQGQRDEEDRAPPELLQQPAGDQRPQRRDGSTEGGPQGDRLGAPGSGPQGRDQGQRRRVGHAGGEPAEDPGHHQDVVRRRVGGQQAGGDRQQGAEHHQELAAVPVADGPEVEHGAGQAQGVADRDQVERGLRGVERVADRRQGDVGHGQVEVGDTGHQDQGPEHEGSPRGGAGGLEGRRGRALGHRLPPGCRDAGRHAGGDATPTWTADT